MQNIRISEESFLRPEAGSFSEMIRRYLRLYLSVHQETAPRGLYKNIMQEVEYVLFEEILSFTQGNRHRAAEILGIHRNTLRHKLQAVPASTKKNMSYAEKASSNKP